MQPQQCLFYQEDNNCNNTSKKEHIIQEGLAGTLSSSDIICGACNEFFSRELDSQLTNFFRAPLHLISPLLAGNLKRKTQKVMSQAEKLTLKLSAGGVHQFPRIKRIHDKKGRLKKILASTTISREKLETIAKKEGVQYKSISFANVPITKELENPFTTHSLQLNEAITRAVALDIIELIRYGTLKYSFPDIARHNCLKELRRWIRLGNPYFKESCREVLYAPISDILDPLFKPSTFSHRIVASFDNRSQSLSLVAQFVNTMPWLIVIENVNLHPSSVSILYKKALIDGSDEFIKENCAVIDVKPLNWRKFSVATPEALEFSKYKFAQEYNFQWGRAIYELDMRRDKELGNTLSMFIDYYQNNVTNPEIEAILEIIKSRYQLSPHINDILIFVRQKSLSMWSMQNAPVQQKLKCALNIYRACLKEISDNKRYGYPKVCAVNNWDCDIFSW